MTEGVRRMVRCCGIWAALLMPSCTWAQAPAAQEPIQVPVPSDTALTLPPRVGIDSEQAMTLDDVIRQVLENNPTLAVSRLDVERARLSAEGAQGSFDPVLAWQSSYQHQVTPVSSFLGGSTTGSLTQDTLDTVPQVSGLVPGAGTSYQAQLTSQRVASTNQFLSLNPQYPTALALSVTQPLLRNLAVDTTRHAVTVAQKTATLSAAQFREQLLSIVSSAEQAYWQLVFAARNLEIQQQGLQLAQDQASSNARRANAGTLAPVDAVEAMSEVATSQQNVYAAQQAYTTAENALKEMMLPDRNAPLWRVGLKPATDLNVGVPTVPLDQAVEQALTNRPELAASQTSASINETDVRFFQNQTKPQVNLVASYTSSGLSGRAASQLPIVFPGGGSLSSSPPGNLVGGYGQSLSNLLNQLFPTTQVRVDVAVPLGNHTAEANLAAARAQGQQIRLQRQQIEEAITADVRNAMQAVASTEARVRAATDGVRWAEQVYASEQRKFQAGTSTVFLLFQRQTTMIAARTQLARAQADLSVAISQFGAATGTTLQARSINVQP